MDELVQQRIGLEVCLSSNVLTNTVPDLTAHPAKRLLDAGVVVCLNSDDPAVQGCDLDYELTHAAFEAGFTAADLEKMHHHAIDMAFISPGEKNRLRALS